MDPVTHTLLGASLAEAGMKRWSRYAAATLIVGANLPDVDGITYFMSGDTALYVRRGWTHGVLAMLVLPAVLATAMTLLARRGKPRAPSGATKPRGGRSTRVGSAPVRAPALFALAYLSVWSHPALDWLNGYGVRLLMPFYRQWFYGDSLFIVDPWLWLLLAAGVVVAHTARWFAIAAWVLAAAAATLVIVRAGSATPAMLAVWCAGLGSIVALRVGAQGTARASRVAVSGVALSAVYITAMIGGTNLAERQARHWLATRDLSPDGVAALPVAGNAFVRDVIVVTPERYHFVEVNWLARERLRFSDAAIETREPNAIISAALAAPQIRGLRNWLRFPAYEVAPLRNGYRVRIKDVRFSRMRQGGIGYEEVDLDRDLEPIAVSATPPPR